jgi:hypothetical protein
MRIVSVVVLGIVLTGSEAPAQPASLKGSFTSKDVSFNVSGGVAFNGKSAFDSDQSVIILAITNTGLNAEEVANFVDRKRAIERLVKDEETPVVYMEFTPQGRWRGLSYYLASGNGCGYCTSEVASTVKLGNGRLTGTLKGTEKDRPFNLTLDVPVMSDDHGAALPADGGAAGKAYLAYHAALTKGNAAALKPTLSPGNLEVYARAEKSKDLPGYLSFLAEKHSMKSVRITGGWATASKASLLVLGESGIGKMSGEVFLVNTNGVWGVDEELVDLVLGQ